MKFKTRARKLAALLATVLAFSLIFAGCGKEEEKKVASVDSIETEEPEVEEEEEKAPEKPEGAITVASFNIAHGREIDNYYPTLAQDIVDSGAEIVGIQEIDQMTERNQSQNTLKVLSQKTGMEHTAFAPAIPFQGGEYGIGVLSKYPIESFEYHQLPKLSEAEEQRVILHAKINIDGYILDFFVTHGQQSAISQQLEKANEYISQCETFIYAGDFNTNNYGLYKKIANSYSIVHADYPIPTSDKHSFDNIILSNDIESHNVRTIDTGHSDHYMLLTDVVLPKK